jgi:hypothetical protein
MQAALDSRKEEMFLEFVHGLRQQSREVKDESSGASMLSIPKYLIAGTTSAYVSIRTNSRNIYVC